jgi:hypothetical protein
MITDIIIIDLAVGGRGAEDVNRCTQERRCIRLGGTDTSFRPADPNKIEDSQMRVLKTALEY